MALHEPFLNAIMPGINSQFDEMKKVSPIIIQVQFQVTIQSNAPFCVLNLQNQVQVQETESSNESKIRNEIPDVSQQRLPLKDSVDEEIDSIHHTKVNAGQEPLISPYVYEEIPGQSHTRGTNQLISQSHQIVACAPDQQLTPSTQIAPVSGPGWTPNLAMGVLCQVEFLNHLWLNHLEQILQESKMSEILPALQDLKTALYEYTTIIDNILVFYSLRGLSCGNNVVNLPPVNEVTKSNNKLKNIINQMTETDLKNIVRDEVIPTGEDFLCAFLGMSERVASYLKNIPTEYRCHEPDEYYIKSFLQEKVDYIETPMRGDIRVCAEECGFTKVRAKAFAAWRNTCPLKNHQPLSLWLDRYVENMFKYSLPLTGDTSRYPFHEEATETLQITDRPITVRVERYEEDADGCPKLEEFFVEVRNCTTRNFTYVPPSSNQSTEFWFHGTDHVSALSILEEGIQLRNGRAMQDFSDDDGFYVSSDFAEARQWALVWSRPAVIIFKVDIPAGFQVLDLRRSREAQWKQIVKYNRSGRSRKFLPAIGLRQRFDECDYVLGPCTTDGSKGTRETPGFESWLPAGHGIQKLQLCIRSEKMAKEFGKTSNIKTVIFY